MNKIISLYTTTSGRIGRKDWWIGAIILVVIMGVINSVVTNMLVNSATANITAETDLAAVIDNAARMSGWASLVVTLVFAYPLYALAVKRRHDRNSSGVDYLVLVGLQVAMALITALGLGYGSDGSRTILLAAVLVATAVVGIYLLVMLGFLKGTEGSNKYGPDPLAS
jgi:uncharacterized membrane protein YhaH (DUF805 family)